MIFEQSRSVGCLWGEETNFKNVELRGKLLQNFCIFSWLPTRRSKSNPETQICNNLKFRGDRSEKEPSQALFETYFCQPGKQVLCTYLVMIFFWEYLTSSLALACGKNKVIYLKQCLPMALLFNQKNPNPVPVSGLTFI